MLRAVIFDYGNTLIGLHPKKASARTDYADVVARPGAVRLAAHLAASGALPPRASKEEFIERFLEIRERNRLTADQTGREITASTSVAEAIADLGGKAPRPPAMDDAVRAYFAYEESCITRLPGAQATLSFLRRKGARLGLLSNATDGRYVERVAARLGMRDAFDPFLVSADLGVRKPRAEAFRAVLDRWSLPPEAVAMVGDSLFHDVDGANRLGIYSIHFTGVPNSIDAPHRGTIVPRAQVSTHAELRALLTPLLAPAA